MSGGTMSGRAAEVAALPLWRGVPEVVPLLGGLTNLSYRVTDAAGAWVVRFGADIPAHHVFRDREVMATRAAAAAGFAPEVIHAAPGVMVSRFIEGRTYGAADVRANLPRIAALMARFHREMPAHVSGPGFCFWVFHVIRDYARTLAAGGSRMAGELAGYLDLAARLEAAQVALPVVFGHHDLLPANLIDDGARLWLIDYEYAGFGTAMFDLAGIASNAECSAEEGEALLGAYFGRAPDAALRRSFAAMQCASLLREAMWSMVSELHLDTPGVDFVAYTAENLARLDRALDAFQSAHGKL